MSNRPMSMSTMSKSTMSMSSMSMKKMALKNGRGCLALIGGEKKMALKNVTLGHTHADTQTCEYRAIILCTDFEKMQRLISLSILSILQIKRWIFQDHQEGDYERQKWVHRHDDGDVDDVEMKKKRKTMGIISVMMVILEKGEYDHYDLWLVTMMLMLMLCSQERADRCHSP